MDHLKLVNRFLKLLENFDYEGIAAVTSPTATIWHNDGQGEQPLSHSTENLKKFSGEIRSIRYEIIRQFTRDNEVLQQHVLHVVSKSGESNEVHAAMYFRFVGGLIERIEEYATMLPPQPVGPETSDTVK